MRITSVAWVHDHRRRSVLKLEIDGHPAFIPTGQKSELVRSGMVEGLVFFPAGTPDLLTSTGAPGDLGTELTEIGVMRRTDDPQVFALFEEMCRAIRAGAWRPGRRPLPV